MPACIYLRTQDPALVISDELPAEPILHGTILMCALFVLQALIDATAELVRAAGLQDRVIVGNPFNVRTWHLCQEAFPGSPTLLPINEVWASCSSLSQPRTSAAGGVVCLWLSTCLGMRTPDDQLLDAHSSHAGAQDCRSLLACFRLSMHCTQLVHAIAIILRLEPVCLQHASGSTSSCCWEASMQQSPCHA